MNNKNRPLGSSLRKCDACNEMWQAKNSVAIIKGWGEGTEWLCRKCWEVLILSAHAELVGRLGLA